MKSDDNFYDNCISLGWFCGTASSMSMHGLRSCSGPFDWYRSDLWAVLGVIENDFSDFMLRKNLQLVDDNPKRFVDTKYGFTFLHDIKENFEQEYSAIFQKYHRRAMRFMEDTKSPTCFLRAVRSHQEVSWIKENRDYISSVIKKNNSKNEIIFLVHKNINNLPNDILWFKLDIEQYIGKAYEMRTMFNTSKEFLMYCEKIFCQKKKLKNICYDTTYRTKRILINHMIEKGDNCIKLALIDCFGTLDSGLWIWGAGAMGAFLLNYLLDKGIKVNGIIDNKISDNKEEMINEVPVIPFSKLQHDNANIFIAIVSEEAVASVKKQINDKGNDFKVLSYDNLYGYPLLPELSWDYYRTI